MVLHVLPYQLNLPWVLGYRSTGYLYYGLSSVRLSGGVILLVLLRLYFLVELFDLSFDALASVDSTDD